MRHRIVGMAAALLLAALTPAAAQSAYPTRPIRLIVGYAAGGGSDLIARVVGAKLSEILHQSVIVENGRAHRRALPPNT